jgi:hypothetical protein
MVDFHCPSSVVKSQPQPLKTWTWNDRYGFLELRITNISMHLGITTLSIAGNEFKISYLEQISNRKGTFREVGVGNWQSNKGYLFKFADEHLLLDENQVLESWSRQLSDDAKQLFFLLIASIVYGSRGPDWWRTQNMIQRRKAWDIGWLKNLRTSWWECTPRIISRAELSWSQQSHVLDSSQKVYRVK